MRSYKDWRILYVFLVGQAALESGEETTRLNEEQVCCRKIVSHPIRKLVPYIFHELTVLNVENLWRHSYGKCY